MRGCRKWGARGPSQILYGGYITIRCGNKYNASHFPTNVNHISFRGARRELPFRALSQRNAHTHAHGLLDTSAPGRAPTLRGVAQNREKLEDDRSIPEWLCISTLFIFLLLLKGELIIIICYLNKKKTHNIYINWVRDDWHGEKRLREKPHDPASRRNLRKESPAGESARLCLPPVCTRELKIRLVKLLNQFNLYFHMTRDASRMSITYIAFDYTTAHALSVSQFFFLIL